MQLHMLQLYKDLKTQDHIVANNRQMDFVYKLGTFNTGNELSDLFKTQKHFSVLNRISGEIALRNRGLVKSTVPLTKTVLLGRATQKHILEGVWVGLQTLKMPDNGQVSIRAISQDGTLVAESVLELKDFKNESDFQHFVFPKPLHVENAEIINLVLWVKEKYKDLEILKTIDGEKFVYVEDHKPIPGVFQHTFNLAEGKLRSADGNLEYSFDLPDGFPNYLATTIFTDDKYSWDARIGNVTLEPAQGKLIRPFTFDVNNVQAGKLNVMLKDSFDVTGRSLSLSVNLPDNIVDIWQNEHDNFGFNYQAPKDGWLVFHYPYDAKWKLTIDGLPATIHRVNEYFIGTPIEKGKHKILLQYWPDTWLRELIFISNLLVVLTFFGAVSWAIRNECRATRV